MKELITVCIPALAALLGTIISSHRITKRNELDLMRLQILSTELAPEIRMQIYDDYKKKGGNSWVDSYVETVLKPQVRQGFINEKGGTRGTDVKPK